LRKPFQNRKTLFMKVISQITQLGEVPKKFKSAGYKIYLIFLGFANINLSKSRVAARVQEGGHYVDPVTVENNYIGNLEELNQHYSNIDHLVVIDTSNIEHRSLH
jgi:predicted ABC-type ATPase